MKYTNEQKAIIRKIRKKPQSFFEVKWEQWDSEFYKECIMAMGETSKQVVEKLESTKFSPAKKHSVVFEQLANVKAAYGITLNKMQYEHQKEAKIQKLIYLIRKAEQFKDDEKIDTKIQEAATLEVWNYCTTFEQSDIDYINKTFKDNERKLFLTTLIAMNKELALTQVDDDDKQRAIYNKYQPIYYDIEQRVKAKQALEGDQPNQPGSGC